MFSDNSLVKNSGQAWKFWGFLILLVVGFGLIFPAMCTKPKADDNLLIVLFLIGIALNTASLVWLATAIRCPTCKVSICWHAIRKEEANSWMNWLLRSEKCPACAGEAQ